MNEHRSSRAKSRGATAESEHAPLDFARDERRPGNSSRLSLALRLALRDLRGGLGGLRLLAVCLFLGVAALAAVGSLSSAIVAGLADRGQAILGGDLQVEVTQREATPEELAAFRALGPVSHVTRMRAMAARMDGAESRLVELKGVDDAYPLYGSFRLQQGALAARPGAGQVAIGADLADVLRVSVGDRIRIGSGELTVAGLIEEEPDRAGSGFTLGPAAIVDRAGLAATGLVQPGSLYTSLYRIRLPAGADIEAAVKGIEERFPDAGLDVDDRSNSAPGTRRFIERLGQFLTLVGLTALVVAGIGVGNGVTSYLDGKRGSIATMKMLGADGRTIFLIYLLEIGTVALGAIALGLIAGALVPWAVAEIAGSALSVPPRLSVFPGPLALGAAYGLLIAAVFALPPLGRARTVPAAALFRGAVDRMAGAGWRVWAFAGVAAAAIAALAIATAREPLFAAAFIAAAVGLLLLLRGLGWLVRAGVARLPRPRGAVLRLAIVNLHRPSAGTDRLILALGLGLTLFVTLAAIETSLSGQIRSTIPERAPSFFMLDIPNEEVDAFRSMARREAPGASLVTVPSMRGSVVALGDRRVSEMEDIPDGAWFLRGDRGLTYLAALPEGSRVVEGSWWPEDYRGPPLVSLDAEAARAVGIGVGDTITVSILGREITARIASLREIDWDTMGFNFVIIFSPGALENAPHTHMATIAMDEGSEAGFSRTVSNAFPMVSLIRVKEIISTVANLLGQMSVAIRAAASVAVLAGIAVLVGALAASRRARTYDSVILKTLGATRGRILAVQAIEFSALAAIVAIIALALGTAAGWYVVTNVLELEWTPDWAVILATLAAGAGLTLLLGLLGTLPALAARPAQALRSL